MATVEDSIVLARSKSVAWPENAEGDLEAGYVYVEGAQEGDLVTIEGSFGTNSNYKAFSKPLINATDIGDTPANASNYVFDSPLGYLPVVENDSLRGKILFAIQDNDHYDNVIRQNLPSAIPENTWFYWAFWTRTSLVLDDEPYPYYFQRKTGRINFSDTITDGQHPEIKMHTNYAAGGAGSAENLFFNAGDDAWDADDVSPPGGTPAMKSDNTWGLIEFIVFTGTEGEEDGRMIIRKHQAGASTIILNKPNIIIYKDAQRFNDALQQEYNGNFGITANEGTRPDLIEVRQGGNYAIIGDKRIDICDTAATADCSFRENQDWNSWSGDIPFNLSLAGLTTGTHTLKKRVIEGYDSEGWDIVTSATDIVVAKL